MVNWSAYTKHILPFNCNNTTKDETKVRKVTLDEDKGRLRTGGTGGLPKLNKYEQGEGESKHMAFCDNVWIECPPKKNSFEFTRKLERMTSV